MRNGISSRLQRIEHQLGAPRHKQIFISQLANGKDRWIEPASGIVGTFASFLTDLAAWDGVTAIYRGEAPIMPPGFEGVVFTALPDNGRGDV